jgi:hypothetical protein
MSQRNLEMESWIKSFSSLLESCADLHCSMQEKDLHTKRTLHTEFSDKTAEAAKPIVLESPNVGASTSGNVSEANPAQMVQPEVNKELLAELESMGFATPRATRALHFTGASDIETAVSWIVDHEDDPDIDEMPLVCLLDDSC